MECAKPIVERRLDIEMVKLKDAVGSKFGGAEEREKSLKEAFKVIKAINFAKCR